MYLHGSIFFSLMTKGGIRVLRHGHFCPNVFSVAGSDARNPKFEQAGGHGDMLQLVSHLRVIKQEQRQSWMSAVTKGFIL